MYIFFSWIVEHIFCGLFDLLLNKHEAMMQNYQTLVCVQSVWIVSVYVYFPFIHKINWIFFYIQCNKWKMDIIFCMDCLYIFCGLFDWLLNKYEAMMWNYQTLVRVQSVWIVSVYVHCTCTCIREIESLLTFNEQVEDT